MSDESNVAKGTDYERFVQAVYATVLKAEGVENVVVQHDTKLRGRSGCEHQIDIYWEFKLAGQVYRTAIECKAFNKEIQIGRVRDFYGVVVDVPNLNGIFATLVGYQSGAKRYADHYGITLKELRVPNAQDWEGRIKDIILSIHVVTARIKNFIPRPTQEFLANLSQPLQINMGIWTDAPIIFDGSGNPVASYEQLRRKLPTEGAPIKDKNFSIEFQNHVMRTDRFDIPLVAIDFTYDVDVSIMNSRTLGEEMALAIIRDVKSESYTFIDKNGNVRQPHD